MDYPKELVQEYRMNPEHVIVLGNGPSIKDYDMSDPFFHNSITIGTNATGLVMTPSFYLLIDYHAWRIFHKTIRACVGRGSVLLVCKKLVKKIEDSDLPKLPSRYTTFDYSGGRVGQPEMDGPIYHGRTAGVSALNLAFQMGFNPIYMLGIDGYAKFTKEHFHNKYVGKRVTTKQDERDVLVRENLILIQAALKAQDRELLDMSDRSIWGDVVRKVMLPRECKCPVCKRMYYPALPQLRKPEPRDRVL